MEVGGYSGNRYACQVSRCPQLPNSLADLARNRSIPRARSTGASRNGACNGALGILLSWRPLLQIYVNKCTVENVVGFDSQPFELVRDKAETADKTSRIAQLACSHRSHRSGLDWFMNHELRDMKGMDNKIIPSVAYHSFPTSHPYHSSDDKEPMTSSTRSPVADCPRPMSPGTLELASRVLGRSCQLRST